MKAIMLLIVLICLSCRGGRAANDELVTKCEPKPQTLHTGEPGQINCVFPVDIKDKQFTVDLYQDESSDITNTIVDCYFVGKKRVCDVMSGYSFNCEPGNVQTVRVVSATEQCEGVYRCHIHDLSATRSKHCTLNYEERVTQCESNPPTLHTGQTGVIKCFFPVDIKDKQFTVDLYQDESSDITKTIVDCYFIGTERICDVMPGFSFNFTAGNLQTVRVVSATEQSAGVYRCHIHDLSATRSKHCIVNYEVNTTQRPTDADQTPDPSPGAITDIVFGTCIGVGVAVALAVVFLKHKQTGCKTRGWKPHLPPTSENVVLSCE